MKVTGKVEKRDLEGGFFQLVGDDGKRYTLLGATGELKSAQGARVEVDGTLDEGVGIAMAGPQLVVRSLRKL